MRGSASGSLALPSITELLVHAQLFDFGSIAESRMPFMTWISIMIPTLNIWLPTPCSLRVDVEDARFMFRVYRHIFGRSAEIPADFSLVRGQVLDPWAFGCGTEDALPTPKN